MKTYKTHQLVMLARDEPKVGFSTHRGIFQHNTNKNLTIFENKNYHKQGILTGIYWIPQHLYILSDDEIKEGEWCFEIHNGTTLAPETTPKFTDSEGNIWWLRKLNMNCAKGSNTCKKVIATTDKLNTHPNIQDSYRGGNCISQISQDFIEHFVNEYNKGNVIESVEVEYVKKYETVIQGKELHPEDTQSWWVEKIIIDDNNEIIIKNTINYFEELGEECFNNLKNQNPNGGIKNFIRLAVEFGYKKCKDSYNTINIKPIEEKMYSREEVEQLLLDLCYRLSICGGDMAYKREATDKFIEQNL